MSNAHTDWTSLRTSKIESPTWWQRRYVAKSDTGFDKKVAEFTCEKRRLGGHLGIEVVSYHWEVNGPSGLHAEGGEYNDATHESARAALTKARKDMFAALYQAWPKLDGMQIDKSEG